MVGETAQKTIRAALYARVSTKDKGQDPEVQLRELRQLAEHRGWDVVDEYADRISGRTVSREAFDRLMAHARAGKIDLIAFWRLDRFGRNRKHLLDTLEMLEQWNVGFVSLMDGSIDTTTATGRLLLRFLADIAQFSSEVNGERTAAGMAAARERGVQLGRKPIEFDVEAAAELMDRWGNVSRVAKAMGVSRATLRRRLGQRVA